MADRLQLGDFSVRRELRYVVWGTALAALILGLLAFFGYLYSYRQFREREVSALVHAVGFTSQAALVFEDSAAAARNLQALEGEPAIGSAHIYGEDGALLASYGSGDDHPDPSPVPVGEERQEFEGQTLDVYHPVVFDGDTVGSIHVRASFEDMKTNALGLLLLVVIVLSAAAMAALFFSHRLQGLIESRLAEQAHFDPLTELPNRRLALTRLSAALAEARRESRTMALLFLDLDRFKEVNDTLGHDRGDRLLQMAGERLQECVRDSDTVARLGGDEFLVVLPHVEAPSAVDVVCEKILEALSSPFVLDGRECFVGASIGVTMYPEDGEDADVLLGNADYAMYEAKASGRSTYRFFEAGMKEGLSRLEMESYLRYALQRDQLLLHFQPVVELDTGRIVGGEALLRWDSPELGLIEPDDFVPLAEETGLIRPIGDWVLRTACGEAAEWSGVAGRPIRIAVNVSWNQLNEEFVATVQQTLDRTGLPPERLELEVTEGRLLEDLPTTKSVLQALARVGVRLTVDDFGSGYSSLRHLQAFDFSLLKVDRSVLLEVEGEEGEEELAALMQAIGSIARSLELEVVAEGLETETQLEFVLERGFELAQGYYFSHPVPAGEFRELLVQGSLSRPRTSGPVG